MCMPSDSVILIDLLAEMDIVELVVWDTLVKVVEELATIFLAQPITYHFCLAK